MLPQDQFNIYNSLANMASFYFKVPISIIVLADGEKTIVLSHIGVDSFNSGYLLNNDPSDKEVFEIPDVTAQPFFNNSYIKENNIRYYLEAPLLRNGARIGSFCLMDIIPKKLDESQKEAIKILAVQISEVINLKEENENLLDEARTLSQFLNGNNETLAVFNAHSLKFEKVSKDFQNFLIPDKDYASTTFLDIIHDRDANKAKALLTSAEPEIIYDLDASIKTGTSEAIPFRWKIKLKNSQFYLHGRKIADKKKEKSQLLDREEESYKRLSEYTFESIVIHDKGIITDSNQTFATAFGYEHEEVIGMNIFHFLPRLYRKIIKNGSSKSSLESLAVRKDSSTFPVEVIAKTIEVEGKQVHSLSIRDNTERKKLENELVKTTVFQKAILDSSSFAIISTDFNGLIKTFNKGAEKLLFVKGEEVIDKQNIKDLFLKSEVERKALELSEQLQKEVEPGFEVLVDGLHFKNIDESEWVFRPQDNLTKIISITVTTLKDNLGEISGYLFMGTDITDKKQAESEIIEKSHILNGILTNMPVFVFKVDEKGFFTQSIGTGLNNLQLKENTLVGLNIFEIYFENEPFIKKAYEGEYVAFIDSKGVNEMKLYYQYFIFPDVAIKGGLTGFAIDITDRIISEQKLEESAEHLSKINKELDQFAYVVSHDLKAPLRAIANLSEWIEEDLGTEIKDDIKNNINILRGRVFRMQNLIDGILNYSRVGRAKATVEKVDVNLLVKEVVSVVGVPGTFKVSIMNDLPTIVTNSTWLEQIFSNLISNAIKYNTNPEGTITIDYKKSGKFHEFSVADNGPGIAAEFHEKIFVIFQTLNARDNKESTGVGLSIVKKIVEEQGGTIQVESEEGKGAKFIFSIPDSQ